MNQFLNESCPFGMETLFYGHGYFYMDKFKELLTNISAQEISRGTYYVPSLRITLSEKHPLFTCYDTCFFVGGNKEGILKIKELVDILLEKEN